MTTATAEAEIAEVRASIRTIATRAGLDSAWADSQIDAGADVTTARAAAFEAMASRSSPIIRTETAPSNDDPAVTATRAAEALACRMTGAAPSEAARPLMPLGLADHARAILMRNGVAGVSMMGREETITRAMHVSADFSNLLTATGNRMLMPAYTAAASPLKMLARQTTAPDFRPLSMLKLGEFGKLKKVSESGEVKALTTGEAIEGYKLDTFGGLFNLSRQAIINDDLGAFARWSAMMGQAAAETEAGELVTLLTEAGGAGPVMQETGQRLFSTAHGNIETESEFIDAPEVANLTRARLAMRLQTGLDRTTPIGVTPKYLLVAPDLETVAEQVLASLSANTVDAVNPFAGKLTLLVEPRLPAGSWYVFADPATAPVLEWAYLASAQGPQLASRDGWDVLGREFRVTLDFGCGAVDYRGAFRNPG